MADYTVTLDADFSQVLAGFAKVGQTAKQTGDQMGKGLSDGLTTANANIDALKAQIRSLVATRATFKVDSAEFKTAQQQIDLLQGKLAQARGERLRLQVDASAVGAAAGELKRLGDAGKQVGQGGVALKVETPGLPESTDGFRLLDGVVQGVAFSLSNSVVNAAGAAFQALQSVVTQYAALDTELRKAAAASGEAGAYGELAAIVDQVGIDAAGTTQEVAQLVTELSRSGMTVDQVKGSLAAIVRGAEATGTSFDRMGSIVAATLKQFGLPASQATRVVDALTQGANASAASVEGLGYAFKYAGPVAKTLGLSVEDLGVAVGLLTNAGIDASEAGVTLRNGLSKLASAAPSTGSGVQKLSGQAAEAARAMKTLGVDIYNADGTLKPMRQTLLALKGAFDKLGPAAKIRLASSMFGGEDDGTKWVALLDQSTTEINKMADAMANTRGATDRNRDAMQGFELKLKQLDGTLGSIGNTFGKVAAGALMPLLDAANAVIGVISGMPGPVKDTAAAFILLSGGVAAATAAVVIYQRVMASAIGQKAIAEIIALGGAFRVALAGGIKAAIANFPALLGGLATLALRIGYVVVAYETFRAITGASDRVGKGFNERIKETQKALDSVTPAAERASGAISGIGKGDNRNLLQLLNFVENFSRAADLNTIRGQTEQLQSAFTGVQQQALKTFEALKTATSLTGEQRKDINDRINALKVVKEQADSQAKAYRDLADEYRAAGKNDMAEIANRNANAMQVEVDTSTRLIAGLQGIQVRTEGVNAVTSQAVSLTEQLTAATRERIQAEQAVGGLDGRLAAGQALLGVTQAIGEAEQARFSITKAGLELELKQAQARGAGEGQLEAIRLRIAASDREALTARFRALVREQELQRSLLALEQEKARIQANQELSSARADRLQAEVELSKAASEEEKRKISLQIEGIDAQITGRERALALLNQTQPLERKAADLQAQTARAGLQSQAAQDGYRIATNGSLVAINAVAQRQQRVAELTEVSRRVEREVSQQRLSNAEALSAALQAIGGLEQSRFDVVRSGLEFELQKAQERGASEQELGALKARIAQQDRAAMDARYQQLQREQELELAILAIKQRQQALEAQRAVAVSEIDLRAARAVLRGALAKGDANAIDAAEALEAKQQILLQGEREKLSLTLQGQSAERAAVLLRQGAADNAIRAEQAAKGYAVAQENSGAASQAILAVNQSIAGVLQGNAALAGRAMQDTQSAQLYVGQAADGSIVIANNLGDASAAASSIKDLDLAGKFSAVASSMGQAATQAQAFYSSLKAAAALPGARWSGGPVEAGQEYRINELGQEAFLSAGRLSLIDAPANSIWRAPSPGVVIPAGVTARLQAQGRAPVAVSGAGGGAGVAELAIEVGKLRQEVGNLARRDWSVHVQQRTGPTGAQVLRRLL